MTQPKKEGATSFPKMFGKRVTSETVESEQRIVSRLLCHYVAGIKRSDLTAGGWRNEGDRPGLPPLGIPCKNARPPLTNYANYERSARDTRIFHTGSVHTEEISTPPRAGFRVFPGIVARYLMSIPIIIAALCYPPSFLEASVAWQFRRG